MHGAPAALDTPEAQEAASTTRPARPRWWIQALLVGAVWWSYDAINNLAPLRATSAMAHGLDVLQLETTLHLDAERGLNGWLVRHLAWGSWLGAYYNLAHFAVTIAVLAWVWWQHPGRYAMLRNALLGINLIGFLVYWAYPVAPPRMLAGFTDIVMVTHSLGGWSSGTFASQANEYAAMPSLHVAWAAWCALAVWSVSNDRRVRAVALAHAVLTTWAVMATANHYFLDVVAGAATTAAAALGPLLLRRRRDGRAA